MSLGQKLSVMYTDICAKKKLITSCVDITVHSVTTFCILGRYTDIYIYIVIGAVLTNPCQHNKSEYLYLNISEQFMQLCSSASYKITPGKRLNSAGVALVSAESKIACVQRCFVTESCVGVNYKGVSWECEIITRPGPADTLSLDPHWLYVGDDLC